MSDPVEQMLEKLNANMERVAVEVQKNSALLRLLVRERSTSAIELIVDIVRATPGIAVASPRLERELQKSRPHTLSLMRKAALLNPQLRFLQGNATTQTPTRVVWLETSDLSRFQELTRILDEQGTMTLRDIMAKYEIGHRTARLFMESFTEQCAEFELVELPDYYAGRVQAPDGVLLRRREVGSVETE